MYYSVVVPTFRRPDEVRELLQSLNKQTYREFEVILADGSPDDSVRDVLADFKNTITTKHLYKKGLGISESRNWGVENAKGDYIVFFDSDCIIPSQYFTIVNEFLLSNLLDAYGGPDRADESFDIRQKAISYAMTSFFTTGGIRGKKGHVGDYQPRTFNMGIRRKVFNELGGFSGLKVSEDIDLSIRLKKNGYKTGLIEKAYVFHKRRSTFYKFYLQVFSFGKGRIDLQVKHGDALKPVHTVPSLFVLYLAGGLLLSFFSKFFAAFWLLSLLFYMILILADSAVQNKGILIGIVSVYTSFIMLIGYGLGMIKAFVMRLVFHSSKQSEKPEITRE
ncbi:MAG TPA: glycosyltransferase [Bacteroidales bacterium]|nr:glycosyltransferase [Bacteroidales bacterium]